MNPPVTLTDPVGQREIADLLDVSYDTLRTWVKAGKFPDPPVRLSTGPLWETATVRAWYEQHKIDTAAWRKGRGRT